MTVPSELGVNNDPQTELVFMVEILSRPSNNLKKSFLENAVQIA